MSLFPDFILGDLNLCEAPFAVEFGTDIGNPQNVSEVIDSLLLDGEFVLTDRTSNRTISLPILIEDADMALLADAEALLVAECEKPFNKLRIDPGDGFGVASDYQTFRAQVEFRRSDVEEQNGFRRYLLTIPALPQAFSTTEVVTPALSSASSPTTATISDGTSATNWTLSTGGAPTVVSGELRADISAGSLRAAGSTSWYSGTRFIYTPAAPIDMSVSRYIQVDLRMTYTDPVSTATLIPAAYADGVQLERVASYPNATGGMTVTFLCPDTSVSVLEVEAAAEIEWSYFSTPRTVYVFLDNVTRTNGAPQPVGSSRQKTRLIELDGSVRTPGTLAIEHPTSALGDVLVHTCPDFGIGYTPGTSQWASGGAGSSETASGFRFSGVYAADVPSSTLPRGSYVIVARLASTTALTETLTWTAQTRFGSTNVGPVASGTRRVDLPAVGVGNDIYTIVTLGTVDLPASDVPLGSTSVQRITVTAASSSGVNLRTDQVWLCFVGDNLGNRGNLTQVSCGTTAPLTGQASNRLFIKSATVDRPLPGVYVGTAANESDSRFADTSALWDQHDFAPPAVQVTWVTTNALDASASFRHRPAGHSHAPS